MVDEFADVEKAVWTGGNFLEVHKEFVIKMEKFEKLARVTGEEASRLLEEELEKRKEQK